ncbi:zf-CCHC domain-containing protein, partial [Tanacetum coccineum]
RLPTWQGLNFGGKDSGGGGMCLSMGVEKKRGVKDGKKTQQKVTTIKVSKDLSSLALDELIDNLKVHEVVMEKDSEIYRGKKERVKSIALKAKKESSDDETSTSGSDDEEYAMAVRNFNKFFRRKGKFFRQPREEKKSFQHRDAKKGKSDRKCFRCGDPNHLIDDCPKPPRNKDQKAFIGGSWSDSENDAEDKTNDETCLMAQLSNEVTLNSSYYSDNASSLDNDTMQIEYDSLCEMINNQNSSSCKIGLGFDSNKASTSETKPISFVGSSANNAMDGSTIKVHGSSLPGSVSRTDGENLTKHGFSPPMSSRLDYVITRKKLIHNRIDESKKPSLKPSLKSGIGYVKTESKSKTPPPRRNISSQIRYNTPQPRRNSREPIHQNFYHMNWNNQQSQGFVHMRNCIPFQYPNQLQQMQVIMESLVKKRQKYAILELKRRHLKNTIFCTYTPYPAMKIRRISASSALETRNDQFLIWRIHYNQYTICTVVHQSKDCSCLGLRKKYRLSLKNDMPPRDKQPLH